MFSPGISPSLGIKLATGRTDCHKRPIHDLGFSFLGSGEEPTKVFVVDQKFEEQMPEDEPGALYGGDRGCPG